MTKEAPQMGAALATHLGVSRADLLIQISNVSKLEALDFMTWSIADQLNHAAMLNNSLIMSCRAAREALRAIYDAAPKEPPVPSTEQDIAAAQDYARKELAWKWGCVAKSGLDKSELDI